MRKVVTLICISLILFIIDNAFVPFISIKGFTPSLLFIFIIGFSIMNGSWEGLWLGVFAGLLQDLYFNNILGINAFTNMICCTIAGFIGVGIFKQKMLIPTISNLFLSVFKGVLVFIILYLVGIKMEIKNIIFGSIYNMIIAIPSYKYIYKLCNKNYMQRKWKF
ncbi:rod shape-determining protein MreD [Clostridium rectalis]|uniref:rod shape-determining protein MreD n=1 Tax=Clostridium rectalis TaxID=2040295 RepID=UPI000F63A889|nr:rod shape-determining protein MreD [Clostridium rectalis]